MAHPGYQSGEEPTVTNGNVAYYGPLDRSKEQEFILQKCEETNGTGLVIEENTIYEIDCECYRQMLQRKAKRKKCVDPFQSE